MKVILNKDVPNLGEEGEIKDVARGYARNFLIPQRLVMPYSKESLAVLESRREEIEKRRAEKVAAAQSTKERLEAESLTLQMPAGDRGRLFGSVTSATIAEALSARGIEVERRRIDIPEKTIKAVGTTRVRVRLYGDEEAELKVVVEPIGGSAAADAASAPAASAPAGSEADASVDAKEDSVAEEAVASESVAAEPSPPDATDTDESDDEE